MITLEGVEYILLDALDEVEGALFPAAVRLIARLVGLNPGVKVIVTCRLHYVKSHQSVMQYALPDFEYLLIDRFDRERIDQYLANNLKNPDMVAALQRRVHDRTNFSLFSLFNIPRYLTEICKVIEEERLGVEEVFCLRRCDFFEKAIYYKLRQETGKSSSCPNEYEISQRMLEKLALIMEIKRTNQISKGELVTILDDVQSNINLAFLSNFKIEEFISRMLKKTGNMIEFHNTEFQEYLAAKELVRLKSTEQVLFDLILDYDFNHIYSNWYDVLRFVIELQPVVLVGISRYLVEGRAGLADEQLVKLLKETDLSLLTLQQKETLFDIYYPYFMLHEVFLHDYENALLDLYTVNCCSYFEEVTADDYKVAYDYRIHNQFRMVTLLIQRGRLAKEQKQVWITRFVEYARFKDDPKVQEAFLYALKHTEATEELLSWKDDILTCGEHVLIKRYLSMLEDLCPNDPRVIEVFLWGVETEFKESITGLMSISDCDRFVEVFEKISSDDDLFTRFFEIDVFWGHTSLSNTIRSFWDRDERVPQIARRLFYQLLKGERSGISEHKDFIRDLLILFRKSNPDFVFELIEHVDDLWDIYSFTTMWIVRLLIFPGQLSRIRELVDAREDMITGDEFCKNILWDIKNSTSNPDAEEVYEEGRALYPDKYGEWETPAVDPEATKRERKLKTVRQEIKKLKIETLDDNYRLVEIIRTNNGLDILSGLEGGFV
ncbi:MAG: hypothetical protein LUH15_08070 [Tannerellaceae bacterium]|nr:hypothetical protein [Tannerellaceae bacterium]